jgi:O-antigen/teichoic acid export membrane protein
MSEKDSYRQIFKSTSLFGGVQIFNLIISIIRSKLIAILIGPTGLGIVGLLNSTSSFIAALTNFGLERSAVKNIAEANSSGDTIQIGRVVGVLQRLVWYTGFLGAFIVFVLSSYLSKITFGNQDYTFAFVWIAITLLLNQISAGQGVVLRGMRQLNFMAKSSLWGSISGLLISVPLYYFWGVKGIVPAIVTSSLFGLLLTSFYSRKVKINKIEISNIDTLLIGKNMLSMGIILSLQSMVIAGESFIIRIFIQHFGTLEDVGFYNAGFAIVNTYFGLIFSALITDYYPRLAGIAHDNNESRILMNQQSEMTVLLIAPILVVFLVFINLIVVILYSNKFLPISEMILWGALGIYFKAASWSLGVIFISKGDVKTLFWSELTATVVMLIFNMLGYYFFKLEGLGISFLLSYIYAYTQTYLIVKYKYSFYYSLDFYKIFIKQLLLGVIGFFVVKLIPNLSSYIFGSLVLIVSTIFSYKQLDKRLSISKYFSKLKAKNNN